MIEKLLTLGRLGMLGLLTLFMVVLVKTLSRMTPDAMEPRPSRSGAVAQRAKGLKLRFLQAEHPVWVTVGQDDQPLEAGGVVPLSRDLAVGRAPGNDVRVDDPFASAYHARLRLQRHGVLVEDLGTTNGTRVNGVRIGAPVRLEPGDIIDIGSTSFAVEE